MPNIIAHYICGKLTADKLNIQNKNHYKNYLTGNIYPDYVESIRHYRVKGKKFEISDLNQFIEKEKNLNTYFKLGFFTHLMLDNLFLEDFVINQIYNKIHQDIYIFEKDKIYTDYTNMSTQLLNYYSSTLEEIEILRLYENNDIDIQKYKNNINAIKENKNTELRYIDLNQFTDFLEESSNKIYTYIKKNKI